MNFQQIRMMAMLFLLFLFGMTYSCVQNAQGQEVTPDSPMIVQPNKDQRWRPILEELGILCVQGLAITVNPRNNEIKQIWRPYKNPDGSFVALPVTCSGVPGKE